jgi:hypothetical protein
MTIAIMILGEMDIIYYQTTVCIYTEPIGEEDLAKPFWIAVKVNYSTSLSIVDD